MSWTPPRLHPGSKLEAALPSEAVVSCLWKANHCVEQVKTIMIHITTAPGCPLDLTRQAAAHPAFGAQGLDHLSSASGDTEFIQSLNLMFLFLFFMIPFYLLFLLAWMSL